MKQSKTRRQAETSERAEKLDLEVPAEDSATHKWDTAPKKMKNQ